MRVRSSGTIIGCAGFWGRLVVAALLVCLPGCGGGTSGTDGGGTVQIRGTIVSDQQFNAGDIEVTALESGETQPVDAQGAFALEVPADSPKASLLIRKGENERTVEVAIPAGSREVEIRLELKLAGFDVRVVPARSGNPEPTPKNPGSKNEDTNKTPRKGRSIIDGTLRGPDGNPVARGRVSIQGASVSVLSDAHGRFKLEYPSRSGDLTLFVDYRDSRSDLLIPDLPQGDLRIRVNIQVTVIVSALRDASSYLSGTSSVFERDEQ